MRYLAIGDIHGCSIALDTLLASINLQDDDWLIFLGDYIDRGPDTRRVLERLVKLSERGRVVTLRGNHELWMIRARQDRSWFHSWLPVGGLQTLDSYNATSFNDIPTAHWKFILDTRDFYESDDFLFAHAAIDGELPLADQNEETLLWEYVADTTPHVSGKTFVCGHMAQKNGVPLDLGHAICIDTYAYGSGWLSCLDCANRILYQANQAGETRFGPLDEFTG